MLSSFVLLLTLIYINAKNSINDFYYWSTFHFA